MAQQALTNLGINFNWDAGSGAWKAGMDNNLLLLDGLVQPNVASRTAAQPGSPAAGNRYIVPAAGWSGANANAYAIYDGTAWVFVAPLFGWSVYVADERRWLTFTNKWIVRGMRESALSCRAATPAAGVLSIDTSLGEAWDLTLTANVTAFTLTGATAAPDVTRIRLRVTQGGAGGFTLVLPAGTQTPGGTGYVPSTAVGAVDLVTFTSFDAGASWYCEATKAFS